MIISCESVRGATAQACECEGDRMWIRFLLVEMKYFIFSLNFAILHQMPPEFGGKWLTKCLYNMFSYAYILC